MRGALCLGFLLLLSVSAWADTSHVYGRGGPYTLELTIEAARAAKQGTVIGTLKDEVEGVTYTVKGTVKKGKLIGERFFALRAELDDHEVGPVDGAREGNRLVFRFRGIRIEATTSRENPDGFWLSTSSGRQTVIDVDWNMDTDTGQVRIGGRVYRGSRKGNKLTFTLPVKSVSDLDFTGATGEIPPAAVQKALASKGMVFTYTLTFTTSDELHGTFRGCTYSWRGDELVRWAPHDYPAVWTRKKY